MIFVRFSVKLPPRRVSSVGTVLVADNESCAEHSVDGVFAICSVFVEYAIEFLGHCVGLLIRSKQRFGFSHSC